MMLLVNLLAKPISAKTELFSNRAAVLLRLQGEQPLAWHCTYRVDNHLHGIIDTHSNLDSNDVAMGQRTILGLGSG